MMWLILTVVALFGKTLCNPWENSGYICVNESANTNLYYVFFEADESPQDKAVMLWLQGGPGASSTGYGMFSEHGKWFIDENLELFENEWSWTKQANMLYVDQPAGVGFSYTDEYVSTLEDSSKQLYVFLSQWFAKYKDFSTNDFIVAGESFGGKYVPGLVTEIIKQQDLFGKKQDSFPFNFDGMMLFDPWTAPIHQFPKYATAGYAFGLLDFKEAEVFAAESAKAISKIHSEDWQGAFDIWTYLVDEYWPKITGDVSYFDIRKIGDEDFSLVEKYVSLPDVKTMMHTVGQPYNISSDIVYQNFQPEFCKDAMHLVKAILDAKVDVCVVNGMLDYIVSVEATRSWLYEMNWSGIEGWRKQEKEIWKVGTDISGYHKKFNNLELYLVRNAGHMAPADQKEWVNSLVGTWLSSK